MHTLACRRQKSEISVLLCTRAFLASLKETAEYRVSNEKLKKAADQEGKQLAQSSLGESVGDTHHAVCTVETPRHECMWQRSPFGMN